MQVLLVGACAVCANGCCYVSCEKNHFVKSFRVVNIKNAGFSKLDSFEARVLFRFFLVTQCSLSLPDLSRKIEGPLLTGYKLININFFKDRSFQQYLVLNILTNPVRVTLTKKVTFWGKIHCQFHCFTYYSLKIKSAPFLKS